MPRPTIDVIEDDPLNGSTPRDALRKPRTPNAAFFVRNHFPVPDVDGSTWRLDVVGGTNADLRLGVEDLANRPRRRVTATLECAGNGRRRFEPAVDGVPWDDRAVGTADWDGVPLPAILEEAGVPQDAVEILFTGLDEGDEGGDTVPFQRSLRLKEALRDDVLVCDRMNGEPLPRDHGAPARLLVPGWYGVASVKWLGEIRFLDAPFDGWFQTDRYVYRTDEEQPGTPVDRMRPKSLVVDPADGGRVPAGRPLRVEGVAWAGAAPVDRVDVSVDGGRSWKEADLAEAPDRFAARRFTCTVPAPAPGPLRILSRATDADGEVQPDEPGWNRHGYGMNAIVPVDVVADDS